LYILIIKLIYYIMIKKQKSSIIPYSIIMMKGMNMNSIVPRFRFLSLFSVIMCVCILLGAWAVQGDGAEKPACVQPVPQTMDAAQALGWRPAQSCLNTLNGSEKKMPVLVKVEEMTDKAAGLVYAMPKPGTRLWVPPQDRAPDTGDPARTDILFNGKVWTELELGNAPVSSVPGSPVLPVVPVRLILPQGMTVDSVSVVPGKKQALKGTFNIRPGQKPFPLMPGMKEEPVPPDPAVYGSDEPYPGKRFTVGSVQYRRGVSILHINIYPVEYRPKSGKVSVYTSLGLRVTFKPGPAGTSLTYRPDPVKPVVSGTDNPGMLVQGGYTGPRGSAAPLGWCDPGDSFQYVIITTEDLKNAPSDPGSGVYNFQDLLSYKDGKGITGTIVTIEDIYANYTGADNQDKIRNFIKDAYANWETDFVLIGGDADGQDFGNDDTEPVVVPVRILDCLYVYSHGNIASDMYYQCLDGTWDYNNDGKFGRPGDGPDGGEVDTYAEVYIGRTMVSTAAHVSTFVDKTIRYSDAANENYVTNALMVGEHLGFGGVSEYAKNSMEEVRLGGTYNGVTCEGYADFFTVDTLYAADGSWTKTDIIDKINSDTYNMINHLGHCANYQLMKFQEGDAGSFTNTNLVVIYSQGCFPGSFDNFYYGTSDYVDYDCVGEKILKQNGHCMAAGVLNSRYGWGAFDSTDGPSQWGHREFIDAYFGEYLFNLGVINADSHEDNTWRLSEGMEGYARWCMYETNLFGDPHMLLNGMSADANLIFKQVAANDGGGGDGDGLINPGETVDLTVWLRNIGLDGTDGVAAVLSTSDPDVTVDDPDADFGSVPGAGASKEANDPFTVSISFDCPTPHEVTFDLAVTDSGGGSWNDSFSVTVYESWDITGTVTLDGNPLEGTTIEYTGPLSGSVQTQADGTFTFGMIEGDTELFASFPGYLSTETVAVTLPSDSTEVDFTFTTATVSGTVSDALAGTPVQEADVEYTGPFSDIVSTDGEGAFSFTHVFGRPAELTLVVKKAGYYDSAPRTVVLPPDAETVDFLLGTPDIDVAPAELTATARYPNVATRLMNIANTGGSGLVWSAFNELAAPTPVAEGDVLREFGMPAEIDYPYGAAFDGSHLLVSEGFYGSIIYKLDPQDGSVVGSVDVGSVCQQPWGLAWDGTKLWIAAYWDNKIYAVDVSDGSMIKSFDPPGGISPTGIAFGNGVLFVMEYYFGDTGTIYTIDPDTGSTLGTITAPTGIAGYKYNLGFFNGALWMGAYSGDGTICKIDPSDGSIMKSFSGPDTGVLGIDSDGDTSLWIVSYTNRKAFLVDTGEVVWLREDPRYGRLGGLSGLDVVVSFDSSKTGVGTHEAVIHVVSNDPDEPDVEVPVTFTVWDSGNTDPVIESFTPSSPHIMDEGDVQTFSVYAKDADADPLTYTWTLNGESAGADQPSFVFEPGDSDAGEYTLVVAVSDGQGGTDAEQTWDITVNNVNEAPVIETAPWAEPSPASIKGTTTVHVTASDPDGDPLTYTWSRVSGPWEILFEPNGTSDGSSTTQFSVAGEYVLKVTVSDGEEETEATLSLKVKGSGSSSSSSGCTVSASAAGTVPYGFIMCILAALCLCMVRKKK